ncbi:hypothetical protein BDZ89DRAFT_1223337 [Hymenopellis radicata]|nr:hypothetical protein BDZ89DRAFT_1223337 [Hymenopellis radicata]
MPNQVYKGRDSRSVEEDVDHLHQILLVYLLRRLIGNTADPVTPLASAKKTSTGFSGSAVLTLDAPGADIGSVASVNILGPTLVILNDQPRVAAFGAYQILKKYVWIAKTRLQRLSFGRKPEPQSLKFSLIVEVINIMRDKLQNIESQLIESKQRVAGYNILQALRLADHDSQTKLETASGAAHSEVSTVIEEQKPGLEHLLQERNALIRIEARMNNHSGSSTRRPNSINVQKTRRQLNTALKNLQDQKASLDKTIKGLQNEAKAHTSELIRQEAQFQQCLKIETDMADVATKEPDYLRGIASDSWRQRWLS